MRVGILTLAASLALAQPALSTTVLTGVIEPNSGLELDIPTDPQRGSFRLLFEFSGGTPDGGEVIFFARSAVGERIETGDILWRDRTDQLGCYLAVGTGYPGRCMNENFGYGPGNTIAGTITANFVRVTLRLARSYDNCAQQVEVGVCALQSSLGRGIIWASFVGGVPTNYRIVYGAVPEPGTWAMMIAGFGLVGLGVRRRRLTHAA